MEIEEFSFVYQDLKEQLKEMPSLPLLLKSVEKTTKKLDCLNLYSLTDKREFDFQLFEQQTFEEIAQMLADVGRLKQKSEESSVNMQQLLELEQRIQELKEKKIEAYDKLNKIQETIQEDIDSLIDESSLDRPQHLDNEIKEVQQDEEEIIEDQILSQQGQENRIEQLKKQIQLVNNKIAKINRGRGKWFEGDHKDFMKIYNRHKGDASKVVEEGVKMLGMKNIEIMDHLEVYESYLQLQKQKKLATEEFKSIKQFQQQIKQEEKTQINLLKQQQQRIKHKVEEQNQLEKKEKIAQFKKKKAEQQQKIIQKITQEKQSQKVQRRVSRQKQKEIIDRNIRMIQEQKEKFQKRISSEKKTQTKEPLKSSITTTHQDSNSQKQKPPKPPLLDSKKA